MAYHYLFTDDDGATLARVRYSIAPDTKATHFAPAELGELIIESVIPQDFEIGPRERLDLRRNAAYMDFDEAESREGDYDEQE